jgi:hypothetical protein
MRGRFFEMCEISRESSNELNLTWRRDPNNGRKVSFPSRVCTEFTVHHPSVKFFSIWGCSAFKILIGILIGLFLRQPESILSRTRIKRTDTFVEHACHVSRYLCYWCTYGMFVPNSACFDRSLHTIGSWIVLITFNSGALHRHFTKAQKPKAVSNHQTSWARRTKRKTKRSLLTSKFFGGFGTWYLM